MLFDTINVGNVGINPLKRRAAKISASAVLAEKEKCMIYGYARNRCAKQITIVAVK